MNVEKPVLVEIAGIAGMEEAVLHGFFGCIRTVPVALHQEAGLDHDLAHFAGRHRIALAIDTSHDGAGPGHTAAAQLAPSRIMRLRRQIGARADGLRQAVELGKVDIHDPLGVQQQALGNRRSAIGNNFQGREIRRLHVRMLGQHQDHRRHPEGIGDLLFLYELQDEAGIDIPQDHRPGALRDGQHADIHARDMKQGHRVHHRLARTIAGPFQHRCLPEKGFIARIGQLDALGAAGCA